MKLKSIIVPALLFVLLQGCIVKSLHPFFKDSDLVFKEELINTWTDQDNNKWVIKPVAEKPNAYEMHWTNKGKDVIFLAHLFTLNGDMYFDFFPIEDDTEETLLIFDLHLMPTHSIAKVELLTRDEIRIKWFNEEWLRALFEQNRIKISHETILDEFPKDDNDRSYVLTAATEELQKFIIKYGDDDRAFDNDNSASLTLKRSI